MLLLKPWLESFKLMTSIITGVHSNVWGNDSTISIDHLRSQLSSGASATEPQNVAYADSVSKFTGYL